MLTFCKYIWVKKSTSLKEKLILCIGFFYCNALKSNYLAIPLPFPNYRIINFSMHARTTYSQTLRKCVGGRKSFDKPVSPNADYLYFCIACSNHAKSTVRGLRSRYTYIHIYIYMCICVRSISGNIAQIFIYFALSFILLDIQRGKFVIWSSKVSL